VVSVEITVIAETTEPYVRYHGKAVDQPLNADFWTTQTDKIIGTTPRGLTHTQTLDLEDGDHYVVYGNSASGGYTWHTKILVNGELVAEGDVDRGTPLRADFTVGVPSPPAPTDLILPIALTLSGMGIAFWLHSLG